jgi:tetratricopeptide (TPR) repeat protein
MMETTDNNTLREMIAASSCVQEGKYLEAIQILEKLIGSGSQEGFMFLALGDVYRNLADENSITKAKDCLERAIQTATASKDYQVVVAAKASLGKIYILEAQNIFDALREEEKWVELCERMLDFNKEKSPQLFFLSNCRACSTAGNGVLDGRNYGFGQCKGC